MPRCLLKLAVILAVSSLCDDTCAMAPFKKSFDARYVKKSEDKAFQAAFKKTGCYTCHVKGKKKDVVNAYGWELSQLIKGNVKDRIAEAKRIGIDAKKAEEKKVLKEFEAAMKMVEVKKSPSKELYAELFKAYRLPTDDGARSIRETPAKAALIGASDDQE